MIIVTSLSDNGAGTLRQALLDAVAGEEITFSITGTISLKTGLTIAQDQTITGPGSDIVTVERDGGSPAFCVFTVTAGIVSISGLTVQTGLGATGGGLYNSTTLTLDDMVFTANHSLGDGGAVYNDSTITMTNSRIDTNTTAGKGAGIYNAGTFTITDSDVIGNEAVDSGGGIYNTGTLSMTTGSLTSNTSDSTGAGAYNTGTLDLTEVIVRANDGNLTGDAIYNSLGTVTLTRTTVELHATSTSKAIYNDLGTLNVHNSTVSGNATAIYNALGSVDFANATVTANYNGCEQASGSICNIYDTILAGNTNSDFITDAGDVISGGHNLFGAVTSAITTTTGDYTGVLSAALHLGPLAFNGGPTRTHALLPGSLALDNGDNTSAPATDQRGETRIVNTTIDIGAYESQTTVCLHYSGTLPAWLSIVNNCFRVTPGAFRGATKAAANAAAQAALDEFVANALATGDLICGDVCAAVPTYDSTVASGLTGVQSMSYAEGDIYLLAGGAASQNILVLDASNAYNQLLAQAQAGGYTCSGAGYSSNLSKFIALSSTFAGDDTIYFITLPGLAVTSISLANTANAMGSGIRVSLAVNRTTDMAYCNGAAKVARIDLNTEAVTTYSATATTGYWYIGQLAVNETDNKVYVYRQKVTIPTGPAYVDILNGTTLALESSIQLTLTANGFNRGGNVVYAPDQRKFYATVEQADHSMNVYVVDVDSAAIVATIAVPDAYTWRTNGFYVPSRLQVIYPFLDVAGTARGACIICVTDDTNLGSINTTTTAPNCVVYNDLGTTVLIGMASGGEIRQYV